MSDIEKLDLKSMSIPDHQLEKLRQLFPEVFTEGNKIDWDKLRLTLGAEIDTGKERFGMNWPGKADCFKTIQQPSIATLVPAREESVDFDTTQNLFIEGDNLEVLKLLQKSYLGKIKMIYIDPPYNTGNDFIYPDNYSESLETYLAYTGQIDAQGRRFSTNTETDGRFHSKWMNMMYPRLFLAKNLLRDDGVIFISIDDNEVHNLRLLCNDLFGEENFVASLPTIMNLKGNNDQFAFAGTHEYTMVYSKSKDKSAFNEFNIVEEEMEEWEEDEYGLFKKGAPLRATGEESKREDRPLMFYPILNKQNVCATISETEFQKIYNPQKNVFDDTFVRELSKKYEQDGWTVIWPMVDENTFGRWRWGYNMANLEKIKTDLIVVGSSGKVTIYKKQRPEIGELPSKKPKTIFYKPEYSSGNGTSQIKDLFGAKVFDNPKPLRLIQDMISIGMSKDDIVLDFFAGVATTADATYELNLTDKGRRRYICIQIPEPTDTESEAFRAGFNTIADIGKERIRRAIQKIKNEHGNKSDMFKGDLNELDLGFKVFKLTKSNFSLWDSSAEKTSEEIGKQLQMHIHHISPEATQEAILYELLLKSGFELTTRIEKLTVEGKTVFSIAEGELLICLEKELTHNLIKAMAERTPTRVICLDEGFQNNDQLKTNAVQIMKSKGVVKFQTV